jgi:hypothetical protein
MAGVGVRAEWSSRTIVGVGLALLGAAQAVKANKVSKIKVSQVFIVILTEDWKNGRLEDWKIGNFPAFQSSNLPAFRLSNSYSYLNASIGRSRAARVAG